jgi:hypothetical protein
MLLYSIILAICAGYIIGIILVAMAADTAATELEQWLNEEMIWDKGKRTWVTRK